MNTSNFEGIKYRLANNWFYHVDVNDFNNRPINYLEIGTFYGANLISVAQTYGIHKDSKLYCIDPWADYPEYPEYTNQQGSIYASFLCNVGRSNVAEKIVINRGYSNVEILKFPDNYFDLIYVDGNHEPEYVLEDAVLSFRKLKTEGYMVFDDYGIEHKTLQGINAFLSAYEKRITILGERETQVFIRKN